MDLLLVNQVDALFDLLAGLLYVVPALDLNDLVNMLDLVDAVTDLFLGGGDLAAPLESGTVRLFL